MLLKTRAIVLHCIKYSESGLIANLYTEQSGRQAALIHGVRKKKSNIHPSFFEPLSLLDTDLYYKENRELQVLKDAKPSVVLNHVFLDVRRSSIALFLGEILFRTLREEESNISLFNFLYNSVQILDIIEKGIENFPLIFLLQYSKFIGIYPINDELLEQYRTSEGIKIASLLQYSLTDLNTIVISNSNRYALLSQIIKYYSSHFEGMGQIKSLQILREVYH